MDGKKKKRRVHKERKKRRISNVCGLDERGEQAEEKRSQGGSILRNEWMRKAYCTHRSERKERARGKEMGTGMETGTMVVWAREGYVMSSRQSALFLNVTNPQQAIKTNKQGKQRQKAKKKCVRVPQGLRQSGQIC